MTSLEEKLDDLTQAGGFSGVVRVDRAGSVELAKAFGYAARSDEIPNTTQTRFAIASGSKGMTALAVMSLVEEGVLTLATSARSVLGDDLPLVDDAVTVEMLLAHRSGIGDYLDEDDDVDLVDYLMSRPVHELATTEAFLPMLEGHPMKAEAGERFSYCNGGFVLLALIAERVSGVPFHDLVEQRVCAPAAMRDGGYFRSDELPAGVALGYLPIADLDRTNVFHLPVRGNGDGGLYVTAADMTAFWDALFAGRIVSRSTVTEMVQVRSELPEHNLAYGLGFWLRPGAGTVFLEGCDAGVSFRSVHHPEQHVTHTVISNSTDGVWPVSQLVDELVIGR